MLYVLDMYVCMYVCMYLDGEEPLSEAGTQSEAFEADVAQPVLDADEHDRQDNTLHEGHEQHVADHYFSDHGQLARARGRGSQVAVQRALEHLPESEIRYVQLLVGGRGRGYVHCVTTV